VHSLGKTGRDALIQFQEPEHMSTLTAASSPADEMTGIVGFAARSIEALGEWGWAYKGGVPLE